MSNNKQQTEANSIWSICDDFYEENIDNSNIPREHWEYEIKQLMIDFAIYYNETYGGNKIQCQCQFKMDTSTSSATKCKFCGKEKWQHVTHIIGRI